MTDKIYVGIDDKKIELKGKELEAFLEQQAKDEEEQRLFEAKSKLKKTTLDSAIAKLAKLGLTEDEAKAIIGIQ